MNTGTHEAHAKQKLGKLKRRMPSAVLKSGQYDGKHYDCWV